MNLFTVTYTTVSPESAEQGEACAAGFALPGGWKIDTHNDPEADTADVALDLHSALRVTGNGFTWAGNWFDADGTEEDYTTGEVTTYALHPPRNITPSSLARLRRLLRA